MRGREKATTHGGRREHQHHRLKRRDHRFIQKFRGHFSLTYLSPINVDQSSNGGSLLSLYNPGV